MSDYTTNASVNLNVNGKEAEETLAKLKQRASDYRDAIAKAAKEGNKTELKRLRKELKATEREIKSIQSATVNVADVLKRLDSATPNELKSTLKQLTKELKNMERGTKAWNEQAEKIRRVKKELDSVNQSLKEQQTGWQKMSGWLNKWQTMAVATLATVMKIGQTVGRAVQAYADLDSAMANTQKFTGMSREEVERLNDEMAKMDTRTSIVGLNELAQAAGRLGKSTADDVMGFVRAGDIIAVAMAELGADAPQIISQLAGIFNLESEMGTEQSMLSVGSAINTLSQSCAASAPNLVDFAGRLGAVASSSKMTMSEMLAFGAVLDDQMVTVEKGATAMQGVLTKMYADPASFAEKAGMDVKKFTEALKRSSTEGLMMFIETLSRMDQMEQATTLKSLKTAGAGVTQTFQTLASKVDFLKDTMTTSKTAFDDATSATEEYGIQNNTLQARLVKSKKELDGVVAQLGKRLVPVANAAMRGTQALVTVIRTMIDFVAEYKGEIIAIVSSIAAYNIAVNASAIATRAVAVAQGIASAATVAWTVVTQAAAVVSALFTGNLHKAKIEFMIFSAMLKASPIGLLVAGITALIGALALLTQRTDAAAEAQKKLNEIRDGAQQKIIEEKNKIELLVAAAKNETLSLDERREAVAALNRIVPNYNAQLDATTGKYIENKKALDNYISSLTKKYELEGAKELLAEIGRERARLITARAETQKVLNEARKRNASSSVGGGTPRPQTSGGAVAPHSYHAAIGNSAEISALEAEVKSLDSDLASLDIKSAAINSVYGKALQQQAVEEESALDLKCPKCHQLPCVCYKGDGGGTDDTDAKEDRFKAEKEWKEREEALNRIAVATGVKTHEDYRRRIDEINVEYYKKLMNHSKASADEQLQFKAQYYEALQKQQETNNAISLEQLNAENMEIEAAIKQRYLDGLMTTEEYNEAIELNELRHKAAVVDIYKEGTQERLKAEKDYQDTQFRYMQRRQKETQQKIADFQKKYIKQTVAERMEVELAALKALYDQKLIKEDEYQKARAIIANEYLGKYREEHATPKEKLAKAQKDKGENEDLLATAFEEGLISAEEYQRRMAELTADMHRTIADGLKNTGNEWITMFANVYESFTGFIASLKGDSTGMLENLSKLVGATSAVVVAGMQVSSQFAQAEADIQIAALEKRYEKEISLAEGNSYKVKKLEKQKEKETAKIKNEANKKQFSAQVVQAIAQSITAGLNAYASTLAIPVVGPALAPAAMALAVATGMMQVALLKKQQKAAEAQGYASGGFTPKGGKYEPAGIVHKGEWVASQELLASPVARPMIEALDYAQRTNTIGSLKADDVSRTISAPIVLANSQASPQVVVQQVPVDNGNSLSTLHSELSASIARLNERLNEPFVTVNTVTGDTGIKKAQDDYDKLIRNKKPKSKR